VGRVVRDQHLTIEKALEKIEKMDKKRAVYYNYFSNKVWGVAESYHLCINSSVLGVEDTVTFIRRFIEQKLLLK
jgi:cytidylate kinase